MPAQMSSDTVLVTVSRIVCLILANIGDFPVISWEKLVLSLFTVVFPTKNFFRVKQLLLQISIWHGTICQSTATDFTVKLI